MKRISATGILIGGVTDILSTNLLSFPITVYVIAANGVMFLPKNQQQAAIVAALHANAWLYTALMLIGACGSLLGGYLAASIAKRDEMLNGTLSSFLCVGIGLYAIITGNGGEPLWRAIVMLPLSPALGAAGGHFRRVTRQGAPKAT
jgi:MFS family permease